MDYKNNSKYFHPNWILEIVGIVIAVVGAIPTLMSRFGNPVMLGLTIVGIGITVFAFAGKLRDSDVDEQVNNLRKTVVDESLKAFEFTERQLRHITFSKDFGEYVYVTEDGSKVDVRRGSDAKFRSNLYTAWSVSIGKDELYFYSRTVSLTEEKESTDKKTIALDDYGSAKISDHKLTYTYGKDNSKVYEIKYSTFDITTKEGAVYSLPVHPDVEIDDLINRLDHIIALREAEKRNNPDNLPQE